MVSKMTTTALPSADDVETGDTLKYNMDYSDLSLQDLKSTLPKSVASKITQEFVDDFNATVKDPMHREQIKANYLGYIHVIQSGKYKAKDYLNAVKFCTFILAGYTNKDAFYLAFPDRVKGFMQNKMAETDIQNNINGYKRGKLVKTILEQSITPSWIINQDVYQEAINTEVKLMRNAKSELVRHQAAANLMQQLAPPVESKIQLDIGSNARNELADLSNAVRELSQASRAQLESGNMNLKDVAHHRIIQGECEER